MMCHVLDSHFEYSSENKVSILQLSVKLILKVFIHCRKKESSQTGSGDGLNNEAKSGDVIKKDSSPPNDFRY